MLARASGSSSTENSAARGSARQGPQPLVFEHLDEWRWLLRFEESSDKERPPWRPGGVAGARAAKCEHARPSISPSAEARTRRRHSRRRSRDRFLVVSRIVGLLTGVGFPGRHTSLADREATIARTHEQKGGREPSLPLESLRFSSRLTPSSPVRATLVSYQYSSARKIVMTRRKCSFKGSAPNLRFSS